MTDVVLDASAVLAAALGEPGGEQVMDLKGPGLVSAVNFAEARSRLLDRGYDQPSLEETLGLVNMTVVDFTQEQAIISADLRSATRSAGLSLGDRACLALAATRKAVAVTADRAWSTLELPVDVRVVR